MLGGEPYLTVGVAASEIYWRVLGGYQSEAWAPAHSVIPLKIRLPSTSAADSGVWKEMAAFLWTGRI